MTKLFILLAVVGLAIWWLRRGRGRDERPPTASKASRRAKPGPRPEAPPEPTPMLACAHCGVHLPQAEAVLDSAGRPFCGEAHRLAGPR